MIVKAVILLALVTGIDVFADICSVPPSSIEPRLSTTVAFDKRTGTYTYNYNLSNGRSSLLDIYRIAVLSEGSPDSIKAPRGWTGRYVKGAVVTPRISFFALPQRADLAGIEKNDPDPSISKLSVAVKPGGSLSGFTFQSRRPPGVKQFFSEGFAQVPTSVPIANDDEPTPNCPGWDFENPRDLTMVTGIAVGPEDSNVVSLKIRLRDGSGGTRSRPFDDAHLSGNVSVLVLGSDSFDVSQIDVSSLRFGPGEASAISSKLVGARTDDTIEGEVEDWEKPSEIFRSGNQKGVKRTNLLLVFAQSDLKINCVLDRALFLKGSSRSGGRLIGGVTSRTVGCDIRKPSKRNPIKGRRHN